jgi:hypothetical protein
MPWARLDDGFHGHPKVRETSLAARGLFATGLSYCASYLTDGRLPASFMADHARGPLGKRALQELVVREWFQALDDGSYVIVGYLEWNPSREQVEAARDKERRKKADQRAKGRQATLPWEPDARAETEPVSPGDSPGPNPSSPSTPNDPPLSPPSRGTTKDGDGWDRVLQHVESQVPESTFRAWLEPVRLVERRGEVLVLQAPDQIAAWVRERFIPVFESSAALVYGAAVTVQIPKSETEVQREVRAELDRSSQRGRRARRGFRS